MRYTYKSALPNNILGYLMPPGLKFFAMIAVSSHFTTPNTYGTKSDVLPSRLGTHVHPSIQTYLTHIPSFYGISQCRSSASIFGWMTTCTQWTQLNCYWCFLWVIYDDIYVPSTNPLPTSSLCPHCWTHQSPNHQSTHSLTHPLINSFTHSSRHSLFGS